MNKRVLFWQDLETAFSIIKNRYRVYVPLPELYGVITRNELDELIFRTKLIDYLTCNISISVHGMICSNILRRL